MEEYRHFQVSYYDIQEWSGERVLPFFKEVDSKAQSISNSSEEEILKWLMGRDDFKELFLPNFFKGPCTVNSYLGLKEPFVVNGKKPGDIDLLITDLSKPEEPVAIEVKRVKAVSIDDDSSKVNGKDKIKKGVIQANKYHELGFHKCYLMIVVLNDGRLKTTPNVLFRSAETDNVREIYNLPYKEPLNPNVGVILLNIIQYLDRDINLSGGFQLCVDREAIPQTQSEELTQKVKSILPKE